MSPTSVLVFVKDPTHRRVKTRLARALGEKGAVDFYLANLRRLLEELRHPGPELGPVLMVDPPEAVESFPAALGWTHEARPQAAGGLGARLEQAFEEAGGPAMAVGTDVPGLVLTQLREASSRLDPGKVVIGPSPDGGYYLIGLTAPRPELFGEIPWSTPEVLAATVDVAERFALQVEWLEPLEDVDEVEDLLALDGRLQGRGPLGGRVAALAAAYRARCEEA